MPMYHYRWNKHRDHEPFPELQTWTHARASTVDGALANASTTAYSRFLLAKMQPEACVVRVAHARSDPTQLGAPSRVRVDGLSLKLSSCATNCIASRHASGSLNRTRLGAMRSQCAAGAKLGAAGHLAPRCTDNCKPLLLSAEPAT